MRGDQKRCEPTLFHAFKHGRLLTRAECSLLSEGWMAEQDRYIQTRSRAELLTVVRYANDKLARIAAKAR